MRSLGIVVNQPVDVRHISQLGFTDRQLRFLVLGLGARDWALGLTRFAQSLAPRTQPLI